MTEEEWLAADNPARLDWHLGVQQSVRKYRLAKCARLRHELEWFPDTKAMLALEIAERYADGLDSPDEVADARRDRQAIYERLKLERGNLDFGITAILALRVLEELDAAYWRNHFDAIRTFKDACAPDRVYCNLLRDIFGNPFRPVAFDSAWRTESVVGIASGIYGERGFERMPILADALQEAGCEHPDVLTHCREPGEHVRGCWVVDLVLGKE